MPAYGMPGYGAAASDLGLGGLLQEQVAGESEEARKKRMQAQQERSMLGPTGSLAVTSLFGSGGMGGLSA